MSYFAGATNATYNWVYCEYRRFILLLSKYNLFPVEGVPSTNWAYSGSSYFPNYSKSIEAASLCRSWYGRSGVLSVYHSNPNRHPTVQLSATMLYGMFEGGKGRLSVAVHRYPHANRPFTQAQPTCACWAMHFLRTICIRWRMIRTGFG
jgi:hypothetical protein